ncbi:helix-turn-helix transcriptional regulator [Actinomadura sp. KC216]|uniref:helix-turn-helix domain-containing protein n=1 Tax=Actinomadura sp. KC216 TaxID=2530370 RepID=UPI001404D0A7|nr:helix-turn-helix transcriptional regulator [Actinomadura sp. KC216]
MAGSPSMRRRRVAGELRRLREEAGLQADEVAARLGWPASKVSRIENRKAGVSQQDLRKLLDLFEVVDEGYRTELEHIRRRASERGWWENFGAVVSSEYANLIILEDEAEAIRAYGSEVVPGLLQTADYARAVIRASRPSDTAKEIDRRVEVRMERQEALVRSTSRPPRLHVILNEAVLARRVGSPEVMAGQIHHLMEERDGANITVRILPFTAGEHASLAGPFSLLTLRDEGNPVFVHIENATSSLTLEKPEQVQPYEEIWESIADKAISASDSRAYMTTFALRFSPGR